MRTKIINTSIFLVLLTASFSVMPHSAHAFSFGYVEQGNYSAYEPAGFFSGIWHGLVAPYSLIIDLFTHVEMYAYDNTGWFYNLGFLIGIVGSLPIGWLAAIVALIALIF